jgi:adenylyl-sulfate kinase
MDRMNKNITTQEHKITKVDRLKMNGHLARCIWLTGLSGSGKSTIASHLEEILFANGIHSYILDGDNLRHGLNADLTFSIDDRSENIRRTAQVAKLMNDAGLVVICALISPTKRDRDFARSLFAPSEFIEVYVNTSMAVCQHRDPKGLYAKVKNGEIVNFTGIDSPYEEPTNPEVMILTKDTSALEAATLIFNQLW